MLGERSFGNRRARGLLFVSLSGERRFLPRLHGPLAAWVELISWLRTYGRVRVQSSVLFPLSLHPRCFIFSLYFFRHITDAEIIDYEYSDL